MAAGGKRKVIESITVQEFLERHGDDLELSTEHPVTGLDRVIEEPAVNRPGLALAGFIDYFENGREVMSTGNDQAGDILFAKNCETLKAKFVREFFKIGIF